MQTLLRTLSSACVLFLVASPIAGAEPMRVLDRSPAAGRQQIAQLDRYEVIEEGEAAPGRYIRSSPGVIPERERMPDRDVIADHERRFGRDALEKRAPVPYPEILEDQAQIVAADDGEWISVTGEVLATDFYQFTMRVGEVLLTVEMDELDRPDPAMLRSGGAIVRPGDAVTVTGRVDRDFVEARRIEASSIYVARTNQRYFASAADEEEGNPIGAWALDRKYGDDAWVRITGVVVDRDDDEMTIDTGFREVQVDAGNLAGGRPIRGIGRDVEIGDRVSVAGTIDDADLFDAREILARSIVVLDNRNL